MRRPLLVHAVASLQEARKSLGEKASGDIAVVMTMGALHAGHGRLIRTATERHKATIVTIFVNPLQFGPNEDFATYPRTLDDDMALCAELGVDVVFAPAVEQMYPDGEPLVRLTAGGLAGVLEGAHRSGHFDGMLTVVNKLLHLTRPDVAYFGQKDAQQLLLIRRMVADLNMGMCIQAVPTVRESDGLAMSSRNRYLSASERQVALSLSRALHVGAGQAVAGAVEVRRAAGMVLAEQDGVSVDYLSLVDPVTLRDVPEDFTGLALLAVAARVGTTRLIDNMPLVIGEDGGPCEVLPPQHAAQ